MMKTRIVNVLKILFTPVALGFLVYFAWRSRQELASLIDNASLVNLFFAAAVWALLHVLSSLFAVTAFGASGVSVNRERAFAIHAARLPARYVPGGIWHTVGRVMDYREQGVANRQISAFVILENGLALAVTLAIGGAILFSYRGSGFLGLIAAIASVAGIVGLPAILYVLNSRVLDEANRISLLAYLKCVLLVLVFWGGAAASFLFYLSAFPASTGNYGAIEMAGIYLFSWGVGFLAIFAPQGIGVFEFVASELMVTPIGFMGLAALIAGFRVIVLVADLFVWLLYQAFAKKT